MNKHLFLYTFFLYTSLNAMESSSSKEEDNSFLKEQFIRICDDRVGEVQLVSPHGSVVLRSMHMPEGFKQELVDISGKKTRVVYVFKTPICESSLSGNHAAFSPKSLFFAAFLKHSLALEHAVLELTIIDGATGKEVICLDANSLPMPIAKSESWHYCNPINFLPNGDLSILSGNGKGSFLSVYAINAEPKSKKALTLKSSRELDWALVRAIQPLTDEKIAFVHDLAGDKPSTALSIFDGKEFKATYDLKEHLNTDTVLIAHSEESNILLLGVCNEQLIRMHNAENGELIKTIKLFQKLLQIYAKPNSEYVAFITQDVSASGSPKAVELSFLEVMKSHAEVVSFRDCANARERARIMGWGSSMLMYRSLIDQKATGALAKSRVGLYKLAKEKKAFVKGLRGTFNELLS